MTFFNHYKTVIVSDVALPTHEYFFRMMEFLKCISCDCLIFCGQIMNRWKTAENIEQMRWRNYFIRSLFEISQRDNTDILFIAGSEEEISEYTQASFGKFLFAKQFSFSSSGRKYDVLPASVVSYFCKDRFKISYGLKYNFLLWLNEQYNNHNFRKGKNYKSFFSTYASVKEDEDIRYAFLSNYKQDLVEFARLRNCDAVIGSYLHFPGIYHFEEVSFMNPGFWSESLTVLAETNHGEWKILHYDEVIEEKKEAEEYLLLQEKLFQDQGASSLG